MQMWYNRTKDVWMAAHDKIALPLLDAIWRQHLGAAVHQSTHVHKLCTTGGVQEPAADHRICP